MKQTRTLVILISILMHMNLSAAADEREEAIFGENTVEQKEELSLKDIPLNIGGRLSLDGSATLQESHKISDTEYKHRTTLYTYLDARPNEITRAFARIRLLQPNPSVSSEKQESSGPRFDVDESWIKVAPFERSLFITAGRQHVKFGTGRFWNPSDFLSQGFIDPLAIYDYRLGSDLLKIHYPMEKKGWNFYLIIDADHMGIYKKPGAAVRAEIMGKNSEYSFTAYGRENKPARLAADASLGLGPIDLHTELVFSTLNRTPYYDDESTVKKLKTRDRRQEWIPQVVTGVKYDYQYSDQKHISLEVEYFYNGLGYTNRDTEMLALAYQVAQPLYAGKHYLGSLIILPNPGHLQNSSFYLSHLLNMSDQSGFVRLSSQTLLYKEMIFELWTSTAYGRAGEFRFQIPPDLLASLSSSSDQSPSPVSSFAGVNKAIGATLSLKF